MNILVQNYGAQVCNCRPATTLEKSGRDFYPQEDIRRLAYAPVLFVQICRAGRSVQQRFADRYFDAVSCGLLLYGEELLRSRTAAGYANASCLDHTSFLPFPLYGREAVGGLFQLYRDGRKIFESPAGTAARIHEALCRATSHTCIRTGDLLCIELAPIRHLCSAGRPETRIRAAFRSQPLLDFRIIM